MLSTTNHRLRQQSLALEGFLEAHGEVLTLALAEGAVRELVEALRTDRRRLKVAERRVALREHEAAVARRRRQAAVAAVRRQMVALRALVRAVYGPHGPRFLLSLRTAISRHPSTLEGQARRAVYALRRRRAEGVRLALAGWEICPVALADRLEPLERELAATVTAGFLASERLFAAQADRGILHQAVLPRLREVRDAAWRACHAVGKPRLAARVRRSLGRKHGAFVRSVGTAGKGPSTRFREPGRRAQRSLQRQWPSDTRVSGPWALVRGAVPGVLGSWPLAGGLGTGRTGSFARKTASLPTVRASLRRRRAFSPGVRASGHFLTAGLSWCGFRSVLGSSWRAGRGPPEPSGTSIRHRTSFPWPAPTLASGDRMANRWCQVIFGAVPGDFRLPGGGAR